MALSLEKQVIFSLRLSVPYGAVATTGSLRAYFRHSYRGLGEPRERGAARAAVAPVAGLSS